MDAQQIYDEFKAHINKSGESYHNWYVGIATDPRNRLFEEHNVSEKNGWWIFRKCNTDEDARAIEEALLKLGCDGGTGGGDQNTTSIYAYFKSSSTNP